MVLRHPLKIRSSVTRSCRVGLILMSLLGATTASSEPIADSNALHSGPCTKKLAGRNVTLEINPKPVRHMNDLSFRVTVDPSTALPSALLLDLSMPGMPMGKNQVKLAKKSPETWEGRGVIVRCMSGRRLWKATVLSSDLGNPAFTFDVRD